MDLSSKVFTSILADRAYELLEQHGTKAQFGGTPKVGCQDGQFTLKTLLHLRHQHDLHSHIIYVDLVKAYDTVNHELLLEILAKYVAPPEYINVICRLYANLKVIIRIGSEKEEIPQTVGVRQGDPMSPVLFLFVMSAFSEALDVAWSDANIERVTFRKVNDDSLITNGQLISHSPKTLNKGVCFEVKEVYFVDDGAFVCPDRESVEAAVPVINQALRLFDLQMHLGRTDDNGVEIPSKTECIFYPKPGFLDHKQIMETFDESQSNVLALKPKKETEEAKVKRRTAAYWTSEETKRIDVPGFGFVDYTTVFKYLGTLTHFDLKDDKDVRERCKKAWCIMGKMKHVWDCPHIEMKTKYLYFIAMPIGLLLWGCETWALRKDLEKKLSSFQHRAIRRILGILMPEVREDRIGNETVRENSSKYLMSET